MRAVLRRYKGCLCEGFGIESQQGLFCKLISEASEIWQNQILKNVIPLSFFSNICIKTVSHKIIFYAFFQLFFFSPPNLFALSGALKYMQVFCKCQPFILKQPVYISFWIHSTTTHALCYFFYFGCKSKCVFDLFILNFGQLRDACS